ncbi:MAG: hypothetical protein WDO70_06680 [Alphaproteobacteria bacterium]
MAESITKTAWWLIFTVSVAVGLFGDVAMKRAGQGQTDWWWFTAGFVAYSATSVGWFVLLQTRKLAVFGSLYPVANALGLVVLGALLFGEQLGVREYLGISLGLVALVLLAGG